MFLFQRPEDDPKYRLYGKSSIWQGAHVAYREGLCVDELMRYSLTDRIREKLFLSRSFDTSYLGCAWDRESPESARHLGVLFMTKIDSDDVATDIEKKEFRSGRGYGLYGQFFTSGELRSFDGGIDLEPWSDALLRGAGEEVV
jgi:predicted NUDIX family phosphoesterase